MKRIQVLAFTKEVSTGTPYRHVSLDSESRDTGLYLLTVHWELATGTALKFHLYVVTILLFEICNPTKTRLAVSHLFGRHL